MGFQLQVSNGQIYYDPSTGQIDTVTGDRKCSQDMAEFLLQDFFPPNQSGSYLRAVTQNKVPYGGDLFLQYYISLAVQNLQAAQLQDPYVTTDEQIQSILQLVLVANNDGSDSFYLQIATVDQTPVSLAASEITQLNQQFEGFTS